MLNVFTPLSPLCLLCLRPSQIPPPVSTCSAVKGQRAPWPSSPSPSVAHGVRALSQWCLDDTLPHIRNSNGRPKNQRGHRGPSRSASNVLFRVEVAPEPLPLPSLQVKLLSQRKRCCFFFFCLKPQCHTAAQDALSYSYLRITDRQLSMGSLRAGSFRSDCIFEIAAKGAPSLSAVSSPSHLQDKGGFLLQGGH